MRLLVAGLIVALFAGSAAAQTAPAQPGVLDQVYACSSIAGERERLACYDAAVGRMRQAQNTGELVAIDRQAARQVQREAFGFSLPSLPNLFGRNNTAPAAATTPGAAPPTPSANTTAAQAEDDEGPRSVTYTIQSVGSTGNGKALFRMSNGQVWAQIDSVSTRLVRAGQEAEIRRASLGSFMMSVPNGPAIRVRRQE